MYSAILTVIRKCMWVLDAYSTTDDKYLHKRELLGRRAVVRHLRMCASHFLVMNTELAFSLQGTPGMIQVSQTGKGMIATSQAVPQEVDGGQTMPM